MHALFNRINPVSHRHLWPSLQGVDPWSCWAETLDLADRTWDPWSIEYLVVKSLRRWTWDQGARVC